MRIVLIVNTRRSEMRDMYTAKEAAVDQVGCSDNVGTDSLVLVIFTPVGIWRAASTSGVDNVGWFDAVQFPI